MKMASVTPVWIVVLVAAVVVAIASPGYDFYTWLPIVMGGAIVLSFVSQLALRRKEGFVSRLVLATVGSLVILAVTTLALALTR